MITKFRMRREDSGSEYTISCDEAHLRPLKIGKGPLKVGDRFRRKSQLDDSTYIERLVKIGKTGLAPSTGVFFMKSSAMGINPDQKVDAMKADAELGCPIEYAEDGDAIFRSKKQFQTYAESHGFFDRNAGYSGPKRRDARERENLNLPQLYNEEPEPLCIPGMFTDKYD